MTTLTTLQELEAVPDGTPVSVAAPDGVHPSTPRVWTMQGHLLHLDGVALSPTHFRAAVNDGLVTVGTTIEVDQVYRNADQTASWYILRSEEDNLFRVLVTSRNTFYSMNDLANMPTNARLVNLGERDSHWQAVDDLAFSMGRRMLNNRQEQPQRNTRFNDLNDALIELHGELEDGDDRRRLREVMEAHGLRMPNRNVDLRITIEGTTVVEGSYQGDSDLRRWASLDYVDSVNSGDGSTTVYWTHTFERTENYGGDNDDPCEDHDWINDMLPEWLDETSIPYEDWEISQSRCDRCG